MAKIRVLVAGFKGRMGQTTCHMILEHSAEFELVGGFDPYSDPNQNLSQQLNLTDGSEIPAFSKIEATLQAKPDVWVDFTTPASVQSNTQFCLEHQISPVIGTTGLTASEIDALTATAAQQKLGGLVVPNFALSAVLMMKFAQEAVKYFPDVEIIELHHDNKKDAPSGTALRTAELMAAVRKPKQQGASDEQETLTGARGGNYEGMRIHSVRLPGLIAHQQVQFGGVGEGLTIRQDSYDRASFMTGVALAVRKVQGLTTLKVGLENVL
ncbi:4-hydroxy-tetrahydrodipicolinate reductase [Agrilactobacillus yilanensis]|uniref:4-hydroxy-tetrahydrodipicolinate reductase n=1 Tax=Agrilactobacillus yilanensis TaxID=2485997 RepID=A0ABW4J7P7_9LACO|nr:4-hydroxy-tetrahydrodipicolinate reductase [Agrilactobacillus yilanensis]